MSITGDLIDYESAKCPWCGVKHDRGMNTLCPFTIAEKKLKAISEAVSEDKKVVWSHADYQRGFAHGWNGSNDHIKAIIG